MVLWLQLLIVNKSRDALVREEEPCDEWAKSKIRCRTLVSDVPRRPSMSGIGSTELRTVQKRATRASPEKKCQTTPRGTCSDVLFLLFTIT
jgi:hypothetical protein